jgi:hypothetical protein
MKKLNFVRAPQKYAQTSGTVKQTSGVLCQGTSAALDIFVFPGDFLDGTLGLGAQMRRAGRAEMPREVQGTGAATVHLVYSVKVQFPWRGDNLKNHCVSSELLENIGILAVTLIRLQAFRLKPISHIFSCHACSFLSFFLGKKTMAHSGRTFWIGRA